MFFFHLQLIYNIVTVVMSWFALASYFLTTVIIMNLVGTPDPTTNPPKVAWPFGDAVTPIFNTFVELIYIGFLVLQFILALGNRPKGAKYTYLLSFGVFGIIQFYIVIIGVYLVIGAFSPSSSLLPIETSSVGAFFSSLFESNGVGIILIATVATFGLYYLASFMYWDPWHMFTSFPQYLFLMSSFTNILNVYAFCNWHDVSWGTKGSDKAEALPSAQTTKAADGKATIEEPDKPQADIDSAFEVTVKRALAPYVEVPEKVEKTLDDSYKSFRTNLIITWIFTNAILAFGITSDDLDTISFDTSSSGRTVEYFRFLLLTTAALSLVRFIGCTWFLGKTGIMCCFARR